ncbi:MAG TPA: hypothetical protein VIQ29_04450 [Ancylobacter sp.]
MRLTSSEIVEVIDTATCLDRSPSSATLGKLASAVLDLHAVARAASALFAAHDRMEREGIAGDAGEAAADATDALVEHLVALGYLIPTSSQEADHGQKG